MSSTPHRIEVGSASRRYPVFVGPGLVDQIGGLLLEAGRAPAGTRCAVVSDSQVAPLYAERVLASLRGASFRPMLIVVPAGEASKSVEELARVCETMIRAALDRGAWLVALGGGVVGDLAGFAASVYYRGIPYAQVPTTIIAQVDSSIGGKTGVNTPGGKNLLGSFHAPSLVAADVETLATLPPRVFNEGFAEIIKHGVIRDARLLETLARFDRGADITPIVLRNLEIKAGIVLADEFERTGERALLNFGHTVGHAVEQAAGYGRMLHGEAVSLGMVAAGRLSVEKAGLPETEFSQVLALLEKFDLPANLPAGISTDAVLETLRLDKKFEEGRIRFILSPSLGRARISAPGEITWDDLRRSIDALR